MPIEPIDADANDIEDKFGDDASIYAEERSEAAEQSGHHARADHWKLVGQEVQKRRNREAE